MEGSQGIVSQEIILEDQELAITEDYIAGYLAAIAAMKDVITPHVGGWNEFFAIPKDPKLSLLDNVRAELVRSRKNYYDRRLSPNEFEAYLAKVAVEEITEWEVTLQKLIANWTCDAKLVGISGKNGHLLSKLLVENLLPAFFKDVRVEVYKLLPEWGDWPWGNHKSDAFLFETKQRIWLMHFGESS